MNSSYAKFYKCLMTAPARQLPARAKLVLCALLDLRELRIFSPKIEQLQKATGESSFGVKDGLQQLRKIGLLQTTKSQRQNSYRLPSIQDLEKFLPLPGSTARRWRGLRQKPRFLIFKTSFQDSNIEKDSSKQAITKLSTRAHAVAANAAPACQTTNGIDGIFQQAFQSVSAAGVELPPRYIRNEYGREERNPASARLDQVLRSRQEKILSARKPVALAQKIILDELQQA